MSMTESPDPANGGGNGANLAAIRERAAKMGGAFDRRQKTMMAVVFAATIGAVLAFSFLGSRTDWAPLMTNLTADDAAAVTDQLESNGTPYELADGGSTVMVPSEVVYQTRIDIASVEMPSSGKVGYGILDQQDLTSSEFTQRIGLQRALEGEFAKTIEAIDGVNVATVHLAMPKNDTFALDEQKATASVMVSTDKGKRLASRQVQAIVNLVSGGVEGLSPSDVTVADGEGNVLAAPGTAPGSGSNGDAKEMQAAYEGSLAGSLENMLAEMVGPGKASVTVSADLNFDSTSSVSETYSPPTTLVAGEALAVNESTKTETYNGAGAGTDTGGILGPTGTADGTGTTGSGTGYELTERQVNNAVNKVVQNTAKAPGAVERLSVAVVVDEDAVDAAQLADLQTLVSAAAGIDTTRGDTLAVSRFQMDDTQQQALAEELAFREKQAAAPEAGVPVWMVGAGGAVALIVILALIFLRRKKRKKAGGDGALDLAALELGPGPDNLPAERVINVAATARPTGDTAIGAPIGAMAGVGTAAAGAAGAAALGGATAGGALTAGQPGGGLERRELLGDLIDNQPDEVAQLLRSWLGDRREVSR